jgi:hypothetical protein
VVIVAGLVGFLPHRVQVTTTLNGQQVTLPSKLPCGSAFVPKQIPRLTASSDTSAISQSDFDELTARLRTQCGSTLGPPRWIGFTLVGVAVVLALLLVRLIARPSGSPGTRAEGPPERQMQLPEDQSSRQPAWPSTPPMAAPSLADELRKLAALRDEGVITADDFDSAKARLLAGS